MTVHTVMQSAVRRPREKFFSRLVKFVGVAEVEYRVAGIYESGLSAGLRRSLRRREYYSSGRPFTDFGCEGDISTVLARDPAGNG